MLRVVIDIIPFGIEAARRSIGIIEIANVTPRGGATTYTATMMRHETGERRSVTITGHKRCDMGAYDLVHRAVAAFGLSQGSETSRVNADGTSEPLIEETDHG